MLRVASPESLRVAVPNVTVPSVKVIDPVGVAVEGDDGMMVTVNIICSPQVVGATNVATVVTVGVTDGIEVSVGVTVGVGSGAGSGGDSGVGSGAGSGVNSGAGSGAGSGVDSDVGVSTKSICD